jgi:hypothetical protein
LNKNIDGWKAGSVPETKKCKRSRQSVADSDNPSGETNESESRIYICRGTSKEFIELRR